MAIISPALSLPVSASSDVRLDWLAVQTTLTGKRNAADERYSPNEPRADRPEDLSLFRLGAKLLPRFRDLGQCHLIRTFL